MENTSFEIAHIKESEKEAIERAERMLKAKQAKTLFL